MTKDEQMQFTKDLIGSVGNSILERLKNAPENWNGRQLRRYIAEEFAHLVPCGSGFTRKEAKEYRQDCLRAGL